MAVFALNRQNITSRLAVVLIVYIGLSVTIVLYRKSQLDNYNDKVMRNASEASPSLRGQTDKRKLILLWNPFFKAQDYRFGLGHMPFIDNNCPVTSCETTTDRKALSTADAVVFHGPRIEDFPPPERPPGQIYVYLQEKPNFNPSISFMSNFNGHMNLTISNRVDSDIEFKQALIHSSGDRRKRVLVDPGLRPRSVVWVVHRCATPSRREWYVKELQKYIDVDVYGECGTKTCGEEEGEEDQECLELFQKKYLFYLSLEYDVCRDYVSEKIFKAFKKPIIPIVFGGANYSYVAPPHSVIDVREYPHPRDLARYLRLLSNDRAAYNEYFAWKYEGYSVETGREVVMANNFCRLCEVLNDPGYRYRTYKGLKAWWLDGICDASVIPRMRRTADW